MGNYAVLATFAVILSTTLLASQGLQTDLDTSQAQAARQEKVLARQVARSAFSMGVSELRRAYSSWRVQRSGVSYEGGAFDLTATGPSGGPVSLSVVGHFGDEEYEITAQVEQTKKTSGLFTGITTGGAVDFQVSGPGCSGGPCVSGIDAAGGENRRGIDLPLSTTPDEDEEGVCAEFDGKVEGSNDGCDVRSRTEGRNQWIESQMSRLESEIQRAVAEGSENVTVCEDGSAACDLNGATGGSGILYVKGDLRINGAAQWDGLVYVNEGGSIRINGGGGIENINGGLVMEGDTEMDMNGGNQIQYNSEELMEYLGTLPSIGTTTVHVTDRSGRLR